MLNSLSKEAYDAALGEHNREIAPVLRRLDAALEYAAYGTADPEELARLRTLQVLLTSGLFDAEFYREKYPDIRATETDPLDHYVRHGEAEGRQPNPVFLPRYYRRHYMTGTAAAKNALQHYIDQGERDGNKPNAAFDPRIYLAANAALSGFVDRPLFHYLKIGQAAGDGIRAAPPATILPALEYADAIQGGDPENHLLLRTAKRELVDGLGIQQGFALYKEIVHRPDHAEIRLKRIEGLRETAQRRPGAFRETGAAGEPVVVPPPAIVGEGDYPPLKGYTRSVFVACLIDARVRSRSSIIEVDDVAIIDFEGDELSRIDERLDFDPAVFQATHDVAWIMTPTGDGDAIEIEEAFTLLGVRPGAFGHWMIEYLPKYVAAALSGALPRVSVLIDSGMPQTHRQLLELILPDGVEVIEVAPFAIAHVRRLWCAPSQMYFPLCDIDYERFGWEYFVIPPARFASIIREIARRVERATACPTGVDRLFLAREPFESHKMVNHAAIEAAAQARNFQVVYPQHLDFVEQARLVRHARYIVGPDGSQMFLAFFAGPGAKLCHLLNKEDVVEIQSERGALYGELGLDYTIFTGPTDPLYGEAAWESDYRIDEEAFCRFLDRWLAELPG